jgi:hypothetical protein
MMRDHTTAQAGEQLSGERFSLSLNCLSFKGSLAASTPPARCERRSWGIFLCWTNLVCFMRRGCSGLPPACDEFSAYAANDNSYGNHPPGYGPSDKTRKCASTGAAYAWPASCKGYNSVGSTCNGAALCQAAGVPATATATCTASGWSVSNKCGGEERE